MMEVSEEFSKLTTGEKMSDKDFLQEQKDLFLGYQKELDERNERHERVVKLSRDITIESKKIIFLLHRYTNLKNAKERRTLLSSVGKRLNEVRSNQMRQVAKEMLPVEDQFMHNRGISPGLQEHIEASAFYKYVAEDKLLTFDELQNLLTFEEKDADGNSTKYFVQVALSDYLLGLSDVGGELMRFAINQYSAGNADSANKVVEFMRALYEGYLLQDQHVQHRDFGQKLNVFRQSLLKVENLLCMQKLREMESVGATHASIPVPCLD